MISVKKRHFLYQLGGLTFYSIANAARAGITPPQSLGPFYPSRFPLDSDSDLTFIEGEKGSAAGQITNLYGQVFYIDGSPVSGAKIEIWQCDAYGAYHHPRDGGGIDPNFQGYGKTIADDEGRYRFKTIKPVAYPGRAPHIHLRVLTSSKELTTQIYVQGNPENQNDFLLNSIADKRARRSLVISFEKDPIEDSNELVAFFNPVLG
ncbi:protocatechuate 3,4-dioxygenase [Burkholderiales bacterium]|nr:protocatechuate 3,4-dioxygenase [Burkholderiales bacterium]